MLLLLLLLLLLFNQTYSDNYVTYFLILCPLRADHRGRPL
jgi:hypothetical protein